MKTSENLDCSVLLYSDWWNNNTPRYSVYFDNELIESGEMPKKIIKEIRFDREVLFSPHKIIVRYENREPTDNLYIDGTSVRSNYINVYNIRLNYFYVNQSLLNSEIATTTSNKKSNISLLDYAGDYVFNFNSPFAYYFLPRI